MQDKKEKKNLKALLDKKKKGKKAVNTASATKEDEEAKQAEEGVSQDKTVDPASPDPAQQPKSSTQANNADSDSEDDENTRPIEGFAGKVQTYTAESKNQDDVVAASYMYEKPDAEKNDQEAKKPKRNTAATINFSKGSGPPRFSNRNRNTGVIADDDEPTLENIDDQGNIQKKSQKQKSKAEGGGGWESLGSSAVQKTNKAENQKEEEKPFKGRPTFTGRAKIGGGAATNTDTTNQNRTYEFTNKYKSDNPPKDEQKKDNKDDGSTVEVRKDKRKTNQDRNRFGAKGHGLDEQDEEDGFQIVRDPNALRRQQRAVARAKDLDNERKDEDGPILKKGGKFGNLGGDSD